MAGRDEDEGKHLSEEVRGDLRLFAFFVGNGSLFASHHDIDIEDLKYSGLLLRRDDTIGQLFAIYLNVLPSDRAAIVQRTVGLEADYRASQWLRQACDPGYLILPPLEPWELSLKVADYAWKQAIKDFARSYGRGTLAPDLLEGIDYIKTLSGEGGSYLEMIFSIFGNVLRIDDHGRPLNASWAASRAAMYIRAYEGTGYSPVPPLRAWEAELW